MVSTLLVCPGQQDEDRMMRRAFQHLTAGTALHALVCASLSLGLLAAGGCVGSLGDPGADQDGAGLGPLAGPAGPGAGGGDQGAGGGGDSGGGSSTGFDPPEPSSHRMSSSQYGSAIRTLFGEPITIPAVPTEDYSKFTYSSIDLATRSVSRLEVEQYEAAAYAVVDQIWADPVRREALIGCAPADASDACLRSFYQRFVRIAWRRTPTAAELDQLMALGETIEDQLADTWRGLRYALASVLLSPHFLWRVEMGEPDEDTGLTRFTSTEMASRLSFLIWDGLPDDELLTLGESGDLADVETVRDQARRMVDDDRARGSLAKFFREFMILYDIDTTLQKDAEVFPQLTETLGASMRIEIEKLFQDVVFDQEGDFRKLLTTRTTYVNEELAAVYGIDGIVGPDFVKVELPDDGRRAGLLTTAGFLANNKAKNAYIAETSPTHRGRFVRLKLLCMDIPPPPPGEVDTNVPPNDPDNPSTLRERLGGHVEDDTCNGCHQFMDPIGFSLQHYDAIGAWRDTEHGLPVDATAVIEDQPVDGGVEMAELLAELPIVAQCIARNFYAHAIGRVEDPDAADERPLEVLGAQFAASDYDFKNLVIELVVNEGFRYAGAGGEN